MDQTKGDLNYLKGLGNTFESEAIKDSLPQGRNNPQKCPLDLYAEQLSGTSFTTMRCKNLRTWLYKIRPTVGHSSYQKMPDNSFPYFITDFDSNSEMEITPEQIRWKVLGFPPTDSKINFLEGIKTYCGVGSPSLKNGIGIHMYSCNSSMEPNSAFYSADGDFLIVPQSGTLTVKTEMGILKVSPKEIVVLPRGIRFNIGVEGNSRGYFCEIYKGHFVLPELGPIGANGLANARDFLIPVAAFEDKELDFTVICKFQGKFFKKQYNHSVFDCVAWHGNYVPFKYNLDNFNTMGTISFDHPDPSIFTVMTVATDEPGVALCDFVIFPPRWLVGENTFRPPYYHRNTMTEFMGNICGVYDAKEEGFSPGSASLHSCMSGHGPESSVFDKASTVELKPLKIGENSLSFMFETAYMLKIPKFSITSDKLDNKYQDCWKGLSKKFTGKI